MTALVATLGSGKGSWSYLIKLIKAFEWDRVVLVTNSFGAERFSVENKELSFVIVNDREGLFQLESEIREKLSGILTDETQVAVNFISGEGKLHMAVLSSLLKLGLGIRLVTVKDEKVEEV